MINPNMLKQWLDMYDKEGLAGAGGESGGGMGGFFGSMSSDPNRASRRMSWAEKMAQMGGGGAPDFFGEGGGGGGRSRMEYVQPQRFQGQQPAMPQFNDPMRQPTQNFLSRLLERR